MTSFGTALALLGVTLETQQHGWIGAWSPGIGDPSVLGWVTAAGYLLATWACFRAARAVTSLVSQRHGSETSLDIWWRPLLSAFLHGRAHMHAFPSWSRLRSFWMSTAIAMLALGINKQLDLQTALAEGGRWLSRSQGWYDERRFVQLAFIGFVAALGLWSLRVLFALAHGHARSVGGVLVGAVFLSCFVAVRASSFHHVDTFLRWSAGGVRLNAALELSGIACVVLGAWRPRSSLRATSEAEEGAS